jgi:hypothetical protein
MPVFSEKTVVNRVGTESPKKERDRFWPHDNLNTELSLLCNGDLVFLLVPPTLSRGEIRQNEALLLPISL